MKTKIFLVLAVLFISGNAFAQKKKKMNTNPYKDTVTTASGLQYKILSPEISKPEFAKVGDKVTVHYTGTLTDGKKFDSSKDRNQPFTFSIGRGQVIQGWDEGIALIPKGQKGVLIIPSNLGYGSQKAGSIPPNSTLIFEVEVLDIKGPAKPFDGTGKDTIKTASGLQIVHIQTGNGRKPKTGDKVIVHYTGRLLQGGKVFDSSIDRGEPISFSLGQGEVIQGWDEGLSLMGVGDKCILIIPPSLGYGANAMGPIPANSTLVFDVELVDAKEQFKPAQYECGGKDTITTSTGLKYIVVEKGNGPQPAAGTEVVVHYTGYLLDGKIFDSSIQRDQPFNFKLGKGQVIKGWDEGVALMNIGSKFRLILPPSLAYGSKDLGVIPPNSTLIFDVELLSTK